MNIQPATFSARTFLTLKKSIPIAQISDKQMYDEAGKKLESYLLSHNLKPSGPWCVIYFTWDMEGGKTDIGISFPVNGLNTVDSSELSRVDLPEAKAVTTALKGPYDGLARAHGDLNDYLSQHKLTVHPRAMCVEEYAVGPMEKTDPKEWVTNIYYLIET